MGMVVGPLHVRRSVFIEAPPSRVWQEFKSSDRIKAWLSLGHVVHEFEPVLGSIVEISVDTDRTVFFGGKVLVVEPERELSIESQWQAPNDWPVPMFWTIRLTSLYGGTQVEFFMHGFERLGPDAAENLQGYEGGWDTKHLNALKAIVDG